LDGTSLPVSSVPMSTIMAPTVRPALSTFGNSVTLADLSSAEHDQGGDFGGQRVFGTTVVDCSTFNGVTHTDLHRLARSDKGRRVASRFGSLAA